MTREPSPGSAAVPEPSPTDVRSADLLAMPILLIDDEEANLAILGGILEREGHTRVHRLQDPRLAVERYREVGPDLIVIDFHMPFLNGLEVVEALRLHLPSYLPILMLTADERPDLRERALASGVRDFLSKPVRRSEVVLRIRNLLEARWAHRQLQDQNRRLEVQVRERTRELELAQIETLSRLALAAEFRDDDIGRHVWRVARGAELVAERLDRPPEWSRLLVRAARLHDVGKIAIPDGILLKPGPLTPQEYEVVKTHATVGHRMLSGGSSALMRLAASVALNHHERWDGGGYPSGLREDAIPLEGRIVAAVDAFDVMTRDRRHQPASTPERAMIELEAEAGTQFDPRVIEAVRACFDAGDLPVAEVG
ncbi:MAG: HD domain-containing phosphohydrolase [Trueperaceae bacterium]